MIPEGCNELVNGDREEWAFTQVVARKKTRAAGALNSPGSPGGVRMDGLQ
jgi:hypothetical protein